jgi:polyhydroxyalkanoate synthase subunit PhaE
MAHEFSHKSTPEPLLAAWIKWTMDFWDTMTQMGPGLNGAGQSEAQGDPCLMSLKLWQAFFGLLAEPGTVAAVFQGITAPSEIILRMAQAGWGGYSHLHRQWLEGWQGRAATGGRYEYENLDQDIFKICHEIYEDNFRAVLDLPQLRLTGLPQERVRQAMEKFNHFQTAMADFIYLLFLPVKKSLQAMRLERPETEAETPLEDFKDYYKRWLRILEGQYMTLFQSAEYTRTLCQTLNALGDFTLAKQKLLAEAMAALSLPSQRDMDGLYREMYLQKKRTRALAKQLAQTQPPGKEG